MVFASSIFLFLFFPITLIIYYIIKPKFRNTWLFFMSLWFYAWSGVYYAIILFISTIINYFFGILLNKFKKYKKSIDTVTVL